MIFANALYTVLVSWYVIRTQTFQERIMRFLLLTALFLLTGCQLRFSIEAPDTEAALKAHIKILEANIDSLTRSK
jgi:hypothetical protein